MIRPTVSVFLILYVLLLNPTGSFGMKKNAEVKFPHKGNYAVVLLADSNYIPPQTDLQDKKSSKKQDKPNKAEIEIEIKQVPKAKRQLKPAVIKPTIKVKPIKIIRPKIKKP